MSGDMSTPTSAAADAAAERRASSSGGSGSKGPGSMHKQFYCTASPTAARHGSSVLPGGDLLVVAAKPHTPGEALDQLRIPAAASAPHLNPFSCLRCFTQPEIAAEPALTQGYARLQVLLAYLLPEVTETLEAEDPATLLSREDGAATDSSKQKQQTAVTESTRVSNSSGGASAGAEEAVPLQTQDFTVTSLNPSRGYVRVSLNGMPVYRSSVLRISADALNETAAVLQGKKEEAKLPHTIFNERIEIQIHQPYSVLRVELFNRDVTLGVVADDDLLGVFELPIHLLFPHKIYDLEVEFPPQTLREENEEWISGQGLDSPFVLGEKRLLPAAATANLLLTKHIFDPELAAAAATDTDLTAESEKTEAEEWSEEDRGGARELQREARAAAAAAQQKLTASGKDVDLLSCSLNLAAAAAASAPQLEGLRSSSFSSESQSTAVDEAADLAATAVASGGAAKKTGSNEGLQKQLLLTNQQQQLAGKRPPLLSRASCPAGPTLRCLFKLEVVGSVPISAVGTAKKAYKRSAFIAELCALALPVFDGGTDTAGLPPLNYRKLWHDLKRFKYLAWDCIMERVTETVTLIPTWKKPLTSACVLIAIMLVTIFPSTTYPLLLFFLGLMLLLLSVTPLSNTSEAAVAAASVLADTKRKPPAAAVLPAAVVAKEAAEPDSNMSADASTGGVAKSSLQAFEEQEMLDEGRFEDSLLKSLLSSAIPKSTTKQLRFFHSGLLKAMGLVLRVHVKLRQHREMIVGFVWLLGLLAFYWPRESATVVRYTVGGAGIYMLLQRMPLVGNCIRFFVACVLYIKLLYERKTQQPLIATPALTEPFSVAEEFTSTR